MIDPNLQTNYCKVHKNVISLKESCEIVQALINYFEVFTLVPCYLKVLFFAKESCAIVRALINYLQAFSVGPYYKVTGLSKSNRSMD